MYQTSGSINKASFSTQIAELETIYRVDQLKNEAEIGEAKLHSTRIFLLASVMVSLLLLTIIYLIWRSNKKRNDQNRLLYKKSKQLESKNKQIDELSEHSTPLPKEADPQQEIISKLDEYMKKTQAFKDTKLTRSELALQIGTNRQYLIEVIKCKKDQTFNEYLY